MVKEELITKFDTMSTEDLSKLLDNATDELCKMICSDIDETVDTIDSITFILDKRNGIK